VTARHAAVPFKVQSRADLMTDVTVSALRKAGCVEVWMGVESGAQQILDAMDKGLRIIEVEDATRRLHDAGIRACYFLQFGYPGERWQELEQTIALVRRTRPDDIGVSFSYPLPGTVFYERVQQQLGSKRNWTESDDLCILFQAEYSTDFYRSIRDALHAEVDSWKNKSADQDYVRHLWAEVYRLEPSSKPSKSTSVPSHTPDFLPASLLMVKAGA
jgi:anaerobic magnesium-protoporphyrin IX monomethyl ester cyclase